MSKAATKWDIKKYPLHMRGDVHIRNNNIDAGSELCVRCQGTGNQLYSMFQECTDCKGTGIKCKTKK